MQVKNRRATNITGYKGIGKYSDDEWSFTITVFRKGFNSIEEAITAQSEFMNKYGDIIDNG